MERCVLHHYYAPSDVVICRIPVQGRDSLKAPAASQLLHLMFC